MKYISILGSTGSIGVQTLDVCENLGLGLNALTANRNIEKLESQIRRCYAVLPPTNRPRYAVTADPTLYLDLKTALADLPVQVLAGPDAVCEVAALPKNDIVLDAVVGIAGLRPTLSAIQAGKELALANKESLVTGGNLVLAAAKEKNVHILPVDSEHSAIFQCIQGLSSPAEVEKILLTASGGPFYGKKREELLSIKPEQALKHPNWSMGAKITIDSATLMNKGLELIEACYLFQKKPEDIEIVVQRESIIHSMILCRDGAILAQMGAPDMRVPIQYALTWPKREPLKTPALSFKQLGKLTFGEPDEDTFLCLKACKKAFDMGGLYPCIANGANEAAVAAFLQGEIPFLEIGETVWSALESLNPAGNGSNLDEILQADQMAREYAAKRFSH